MNLLPQTHRARQRRACGGFLDMFSNKTTSSYSSTSNTTNTTTSAVSDAYNNTYNKVNNVSVNLGDQFAKALGAVGGDAGGVDVKKILLWVAGGFAGVLLLKWFFRK